MTARDFKGIWIPKEIWLVPGLSKMAIILWAEIHSLYSPRHGGCYASNDYLCEFLGVKERQLQKYLRELKDAGLLKQKAFNGRSRMLLAQVPAYEQTKFEDEYIESECGADPHYSAGQGCTKVRGRPVESCAPTLYKKKEDNKGIESQLANASRRRATFLFEKVKSINPKARKPNLDNWAKDIEKIMRIDGRSEEEVTHVIEWVFNDDFWCKNILSGRKLREKFDQLYINMVKHKESPKKKEESDAKRKADMCRKNKKWAKEFLHGKIFVERDNWLSLKDNGVEVMFHGRWQIIGFLENGFQEQIKNWYQKVAE
jgi:hypothetical protein